jgi:cell division protein FtsB
LRLKLLILVILSMKLLLKVTLGQNNPSPIQFHGTINAFGQYSNRQGSGSEIPASYFRDDMQATLTIYDIPISSSCFITTEQRGFRQAIDNFRIYLDVAALKRKGLEKGKAVVNNSALAKLQKTKDDLAKSMGLLNSNLLDQDALAEQAQSEYQKAKTQFADSASEESLELMQKAKSNMKAARAKAAEAKTMVEETKAKVAEAEEVYNKAKQLYESRDALPGKAEEMVKGKAMSKGARFFSLFSTLEFGKCRPNYSELTLKGISVSGVNIEFTPGIFYAAFSAGKVLRPVKPNSTTLPTYKRNILFAKIGVGRKNESHFYLSYMKAEDKPASLPAELGVDTRGIDTLGIHPKSNHIAAAELKIYLFKKKFSIEGEAAVSLLTHDQESLQMLTNGVPGWVMNYFKPNVSSTVDYAYNAKAILDLATTKITGGIRMVGPGFKSLGNPNLVSDKLTYDGKIDQTFSRNRINISAFAKKSHDNMINWKIATTNTFSYGLSGGMRFDKAPYVQLSYSPIFQSTDFDTMKIENSIRILSAATGYIFSIGSVSTNTSFNLFYQRTKMLFDTSNSFNANVSYTLTEVITFKIPLSLSGSICYNRLEMPNFGQNIFIYNISGTFRLFKNRTNNSVGFTYYNQGGEQNKLGFFMASRIQLWNMGDMEIRIDKNSYKDKVSTTANYNFNEFIAQATLTVKW